jgi:glutamine synthetase
MQREEIVFVGTSDLSGHFRGKSFPVADLAARLQRGVGLAPTNIFLGSLGPIQYTAFGTVGEVFLVPDPTTRVVVPFAGSASEIFYIGDIRTLDETPWDFCPRHVLRRALDRLEKELGLKLLATFEQEFIYSGVPDQPWQPYALDAFRRQGAFGEALLAALRHAKVIPDSFLAEYGPRQFEVTSAPAVGICAADHAVITREISQAVAYRMGHRVSFTPIPKPDGVSNGTHIHFSFLDQEDRPVLYDESLPAQLSHLGSAFLAGVQHHLPALCGVTAPSLPSYYRLRPNHWAPVHADVGALDRGASLRICPVSSTDPAQRARQFNLEYRVADATASPYLALAMIVQAGLDGVRERREIDWQSPRPLPTDLESALGLLEQSTTAAEWLGHELLGAYLKFKRAEIKGLENLDESEICRRYAESY